MSRGRGTVRHVTAACWGLILWIGSSWPASAPDEHPPTAILIVARDHLPDPSFSNSIVLVMNDLGLGPTGLVINRPTQIPVSHLFPKLERLSKVSDKVYFGGPVEPESVWFLFRAASPQPHAVRTCEGVYLSADGGLLNQLLHREQPMQGLRVFVGHAGWAPGQLESEIERGDWTPKRADAEAIFGGKSDRPWPSHDTPDLET
jgi:putative transcriptional regulator